MDTRQHRLSHAWLITATTLYALSLLGWPLAFISTLMALGGSAGFVWQGYRLPGAFSLLVLPVLAYPVAVVVCLEGGWSQHAKHHYRAAFWLSLLPFGDIALVFLGLELLSLMAVGHF